MKITKTNETTVEVDPWPDTEKVNIHVDVDGITDNRPIDTIVLPRKSAQSVFLGLMTSKNGKIFEKINMTEGVVKRPQVDESGSRFIAEILEPITGKNFSGEIKVKIELRPNSSGLLLDNAFGAYVDPLSSDDRKKLELKNEQYQPPTKTLIERIKDSLN